MHLNEIKLKRLTESTKHKNASTTKKELEPNKLGAVDLINEGIEKHHTPKFVQHCVTAITQDTARLNQVQQKKGGSPFAVCQAQYDKSKGSLAAKHSQGKHHSVKDYEKALATLRETVESRSRQNVDPRGVVYSPYQPLTLSRNLIRFEP